MFFREFNDDEVDAFEANGISRSIDKTKSQVEAKRAWRGHCRTAINKSSTQELKWCIEEAADLEIPSDDPTLLAVQKCLHAHLYEDDHHPTRTELTAVEPSNLNRMEEGALAKKSMMGENDLFLGAVSHYLENLKIAADTLEPINGQEQLRKLVEVVWLQVDVDKDGQLSSTEAREAIRVFLSCPQIRDLLGEALLEKTQTIMEKDDGLRQTWSDMLKESAMNRTRTVNQLCKRSVSQACLDMARRLPRVTDAFWDTMDVDKNGHVIGEEFVESFEKASCTHLLKPVFKIAEERVWDIILSGAWKENEFEILDQVAKNFRKRQRKLGLPSGPPVNESTLQARNDEDEEERPGQRNSCSVCTQEDCVIC
eukprot:gnl/MRDRNA2_/MRDRNA2_120991_c0_seq1.p1 gnl/MRDRNA2_/MRDRNA2_120991_c0~~gnl/MRDRNA2_/MRDRNA2_120991_c0_seq1.p1  ORF type:complete len:368 (-),score=63.41 gnl/MRDRNA2_/MRDRNA2_120991_c0_seq1:414-1517(-)